MEGLDAWELVLLGLALPLYMPLLALSEGGRAGRTLSAEEVCWGLGLRGGFCTCFDFGCNSSQNKISCGTKKILLAIAYLGF